MKVILVRHAEAGERNPRRYPDDDLRPLSSAGRRAQVSSARSMLHRGILFDHLVSSPLLRAEQTAEVIADVYGFDGLVHISDALGHGCSPVSVTRLLARFPHGAAIALVGHEPALSKVAGALVGGHMLFDLKKSGVIGIGFDGPVLPGRGTLLYHLKPGAAARLKAAS